MFVVNVADDNSLGNVAYHGTKAAVDVTFGYIGLLGPIGAGVSLTYFGLTAVAGFGWNDSTEQTFHRTLNK